MKEESPAEKLRQLISARELEHKEEAESLKAHFNLTYESLKPANLLKNFFRETITSPGLKVTLLDAAIGMAAGFIAKKALTGSSRNPLAKLAGGLLETVVANTVTSHAGCARTAVSGLLEKLLHTENDPGKT